jgi:BirA family transcriptional regulator, biotin operon repressor / biotin---[acetyl-CoA-carboxylase] ligase
VTASPRLPEGWVEHAFDQVASTNDLAREMALAGAASGQVVVANEQTRGRGRYGRAWASPPGNLYASVMLRPGCAAADAPQLSLLAGLALAEALEQLGPPGLGVTLKWPNDVLLGDAKVAGILLESAAAPDGRAAWVIVGTGVNLVWCPDDVPYPATTLAREGFAATLTPAHLLAAYLTALDGWLARWREQGFPAVREAWRGRSFGLGTLVRLRLEHEEVAGRFVGLGAGGALLLELADGRRREITTGDVFWGGS